MLTLNPLHPPRNLDAAGFAQFIRTAYLTTDAGETIRTQVTSDGWGVKIYPVEVTRYAAPNLFTVNMTVGAPWTLTVVWDSAGWSNTTAWPCQLSQFTPWEAGALGF